MKKTIALVSVISSLSSFAYADITNVSTGESPEEVYVQYQSINQVTESMKTEGFTMHRYGIKALRNNTQARSIHIALSTFLILVHITTVSVLKLKRWV